MSKKDEALKLALEALEVATTPFARDRQDVLRAQAALREALAEQPAQQQEFVEKIISNLEPLLAAKNQSWAYAENALLELLAAAPQPAQHTEQPLEMVDTYCKAWEQSFLADNPYHTVQITAADRKHIEAGLKAALAEQPAQQEPVAWLHPANATCVTTDPSAYARGVPLYTTPQPAQRTWVGLTDKERKEIERQSVYVEGAIRMTEAKLKEKNT